MRTSIAVLLLLIVVGAVYLVIRFHPISAPGTPSGTATSTQPTNVAVFYCAGDVAMQATFATSSVALLLSDGRSFTLPQTVSASGARYETTASSTDIVFWNKGDNAFITENGKTTFENCTAAKIVNSDAPGYALYSDQHDTFSFAFPTNLSVAGSAPGYSTDWAAGVSTSGMQLAKVATPAGTLPNTNFVDAGFTVGTSADSSAVANCLKSPSGNPSTATTTTIGGVAFTKLTFSDAAAGNRYDTTSYRTVHNNQCYAVEYTIHYGVLANYPKGTTEFNEAQVQAAFDEVANSFQFLGS